MRLLARDDLAGFGNIGEGMAIQQMPGGRRIMWLAHENVKEFTGVDVTDPSHPRVIVQTDLPHQEMRSNSLAVVGDIMYVAHQTAKDGLPEAGMAVYDIADPESPKRIGTFDVTAPGSRGAHCLWCVDGHYAHLSSSLPGVTARNSRDVQFYVIVDVSDPTHPVEAGHWWLPGTMEGDTEEPPERHPAGGEWGGSGGGIDMGYGVHNANVYPRRPDRAYCGCKDAGLVILDISDIAHPTMVSRLDYHPPMPGMTHTALPLFDRELLIVTDEALRGGGEDWPKMTWVMDMRVETNPVVLGTLPLPDTEEFFNRPGRVGSHNLHENQPVPTSFISEELVFGTYFNAGIRVHDISNPFQPEEKAYFIPEMVEKPEGAPAPFFGHSVPGMNLNDVYVDENRLVYTVDRQWGGLYILELTV